MEIYYSMTVEMAARLLYFSADTQRKFEYFHDALHFESIAFLMRHYKSISGFKYPF